MKTKISGAGLDLLLNVRRSGSGAVEYLNRKMFGDYKILKDLKLLKQKAEKALNIYNASQAQKNMAFAGKLSDCEVAALSAYAAVYLFPLTVFL